WKGSTLTWVPLIAHFNRLEVVFAAVGVLWLRALELILAGRRTLPPRRYPARRAPFVVSSRCGRRRHPGTRNEHPPQHAVGRRSSMWDATDQQVQDVLAAFDGAWLASPVGLQR